MNEIQIKESDIIKKSLEAPPLDPLILEVANCILEGRNIQDIADEFSVPGDVITNIAEKKEVKAYINQVYLSEGYMNRIKRLKLMDTVINQKLEDALETGLYSKKDLLDWLKEYNVMEQNTKPKNTTPAVAIQVNNNYENLMKDLAKDG